MAHGSTHEPPTIVAGGIGTHHDGHDGIVLRKAHGPGSVKLALLRAEPTCEGWAHEGQRGSSRGPQLAPTGKVLLAKALKEHPIRRDGKEKGTLPVLGTSFSSPTLAFGTTIRQEAQRH